MTRGFKHINHNFLELHYALSLTAALFIATGTQFHNPVLLMEVEVFSTTGTGVGSKQ
jgi:hypothetical protein